MEDSVPTQAERVKALEEQVAELDAAIDIRHDLTTHLLERMFESLGHVTPPELAQLKALDILHNASTISQGQPSNKRGRHALVEDGQEVDTSRKTSLVPDCLQDSALIRTATEIFINRCAAYTPYIDLTKSADQLLADLELKSRLLYCAVIAVGSREAEELQSLHRQSKEQLMMALHRTLVEPATLHDLQGESHFIVWAQCSFSNQPVLQDFSSTFNS